MPKHSRLSLAIAAALGGMATVLVSPAVAQGAAPTVPNETKDSGQVTQKLERVEVTGSRIRSLNYESSAPVTVVTAREIAASGITNVQQLLQALPTMGVPGISRTNSNFATASAGVSTVDLRDLGSSRTLVLVNGIRYVAGIPGESAVDLNTIPTDFIERIEVLTGGASATYGSDAVAGVVNIILKRSVNGVELNVHAGKSGHNDDELARFGLTFGGTLDGGKGSLMGYIGYSSQGAVMSRDRAISAIDQISLGVRNGNPNDFFSVSRPFFSGFTPQGYVNAGGVTTTFDRNGNVIPVSTNGSSTTAATGFNRSDFRTIAIPTDRLLLSSKADFALSDSKSIFYEGTFAATRTKSELEPFPLNSDDIYSNARAPAELLVNGVLVRNPYIPDAIYNRATDTDGDGLKDYSFTRRLSEVGNRGNVANRNTYRLLAGSKGTLLSEYDYNIYVGRGATTETQTSNGQVNVQNFRNALEAIVDSSGNPICRDATARSQGCVPINIFGFNSISADALKYVTAPGSLSTETIQNLAGGSISGEVASLPAGPLSMAAGFEVRKEFARSEFDALSQSGLNGGNKIPSTQGSFSVKDLFLEAKAPIVKNLEFARELSASAGLRTGDYSTVGKVLSWNSGVNWTLNPLLKFRFSRSASTRAPNINELFSPPSQTFPSDLVDPCVGVTANSVGVVDTACRNDPGVAANIAANGSFTLNQADIQGISGFDRGNPKVKEEVGRSWTLGAIMTPAGIPGLEVSVDYFNISVADAIVSTPRSFILDQCYGGDPSFCQFITRRSSAIGANSAGSIQFIDSTVTNSGELATSGVDVTLAYRGKLWGGDVTSVLNYTYLHDGYLIPLPGSDQDKFVGEVGTGVSRNRATLALGYRTGPFGFYSTTTFIGPASLDDQFLKALELAPNSAKVKGQLYNSFSIAYQVLKTTEFYFGIDNAFDRDPPLIPTGLPGNITGAETASDVYDAIGRRYYAGVRLKF